MDYNNLKLIKHLEWYDGPLLSEFRDDENNCYLFNWVDLKEIDCIEDVKKDKPKYNFWCVFNVTNENLQSYLDNKLSLRDLLLKSKNDTVDVIIEINNKFERNSTVSKKELIDNYGDHLPKEGVMRYND